MAPYLLGETFGTVFTHHASVKALWDEVWKFQCSKSIYPFNDSDIRDFEPLFDHLIKNDINDAMDERWPELFLPAMKALMDKADSKAHSGDEDASKMYLRVACLGHIGRYPVLNTPLRRELWELQKKAYLKGTSYWPSPPHEVIIPHTHAIKGEGREISAFVRLPEHASASSPVPCVIMITGLDGFKCDIPPAVTNFQFAHGWGYVAVEIPGSGDSPALKNDPKSPDRTWSSILDWINDNPVFDNDSIAAWGLSTGGYYAVRIAHTHADRLKGVIAQGAGCHMAFDREWMEAADDMEYPMRISPALAFKYGYADVETMMNDAKQRFSLVENKIVEMPHTRLLMIGGTSDSIFPIEDNYLMLQYGGPKEARFQMGSQHMGEPCSTPVGSEWLKTLFAKSPITHNGDQNGLQNGHQNGVQNGHPNGHQNGLQNGLQNGQQNGYWDGLHNDHQNGHQNGLQNGH